MGGSGGRCSGQWQCSVQGGASVPGYTLCPEENLPAPECHAAGARPELKGGEATTSQRRVEQKGELERREREAATREKMDQKMQRTRTLCDQEVRWPLDFVSAPQVSPGLTGQYSAM